MANKDSVYTTDPVIAPAEAGEYNSGKMRAGATNVGPFSWILLKKIRFMDSRQENSSQIIEFCAFREINVNYSPSH